MKNKHLSLRQRIHLKDLERGMIIQFEDEHRAPMSMYKNCIRLYLGFELIPGIPYKKIHSYFLADMEGYCLHSTEYNFKDEFWKVLFDVMPAFCICKLDPDKSSRELKEELEKILNFWKHLSYLKEV